MDNKDKELYTLFVSNPLSIPNILRVKKRCVELQNATDTRRDALPIFRTLLMGRRPLFIKESVFVPATECDWDTAADVLSEISGCVSVAFITRMNNVMIYKGIARALPISPGPDGDYYMFMAQWESTVFNMYHTGEDIKAIYKSGIRRSTHTPNACFHRGWINSFDLCAPEINSAFVKFAEFNIPNTINVYICDACLNNPPPILEIMLDYVQEKYNEHMRYPAALSLLLYAHARLEDNVFYKFNLGRDIFKAILRNVFPPAFALIK